MPFTTCHSHDKNKLYTSEQRPRVHFLTGLQGGKAWSVNGNPVGWYLVNGIIWGTKVSVENISRYCSKWTWGPPFILHHCQITMIQLTYHAPKIGRKGKHRENFEHLSTIPFTRKLPVVPLRSNLDDSCIDYTQGTPHWALHQRNPGYPQHSPLLLGWHHWWWFSLENPAKPHQKRGTLPETNIAPENGWLED